MKNVLARFDFSYLYAFLGELTLGLTFVFYILLARILGPEQYGIFASATALGAILALFIQFGLPTLINREVAANPLEGSRVTLQYLLLEVLSTLPVLLLLLPLALLLNFEGQGLIICYLTIASELCRAMKMTLRGVLKGHGWFRAESIAVALERASVVFIASTVLFVSQQLIPVVITVVIVRGLDIAGLLYYLNRKFSLVAPMSVPSFIKLYQQAYPFAVSGVLWILYYQVDVIMLKAMATDVDAGFYNAAYRILEMFLALPRVVFQVLFTRFAKYYATEPKRLPDQIYKGTRLLVTAVLPAVIIAICLKSIIITKLYGTEYTASISALAILLPSVSISMFGNLSHRFLQATGQEKSLPKLLMLTALVNVGINFLLIPEFGIVGAAIATLISELVLCLLGLWQMRRVGYQKASRQVTYISLLSLIATGSLSLSLSGYYSIFHVVVIVASLAGILLMISRRDDFLGSVSQTSETDEVPLKGD
jgi:O-antigen/teichoic acid export membrane protein